MIKTIITSIDDALIRLAIEDILSKYTLIVGDLGTGKTRLTAKLVSSLLRRGYNKKITIIDLAPEAGGIGLRLDRYIPSLTGVRYLAPSKVYAPRLYARTVDELKKYIVHNYTESLKLFQSFVDSPTDILVVNDLSIFLHHGDSDMVVRFLSYADTFIGNSYYGVRLRENFGLGLDNVEKDRVEELSKYMDLVIKLI
jgi:hypothetical protein